MSEPTGSLSLAYVNGADADTLDGIHAAGFLAAGATAANATMVSAYGIGAEVPDMGATFAAAIVGGLYKYGASTTSAPTTAAGAVISVSGSVTDQFIAIDATTHVTYQGYRAHGTGAPTWVKMTNSTSTSTVLDADTVSGYGITGAGKKVWLTSSATAGDDGNGGQPPVGKGTKSTGITINSGAVGSLIVDLNVTALALVTIWSAAAPTKGAAYMFNTIGGSPYGNPILLWSSGYTMALGAGTWQVKPTNTDATTRADLITTWQYLAL